MMPLEDWELVDSEMTPDRWRENGAHLQASGDRRFAAAAVTACRRSRVGYSELFVAEADPQHV